MKTEFETQVLDIDKDAITAKLRSLGAREEEEVCQRRWVFDIEPCQVESTGKWIRLRQVGNKKPTLTYKNKLGKGLSETKELEVYVADFDKTAEILSKADFKGQFYQENKRLKFIYRKIEFSLDSWPKIPTFLEIEAGSEEEVEEGLELLGLKGRDVGHLGILAIYHHYGIDLHAFPKLTF